MARKKRRNPTPPPAVATSSVAPRIGISRREMRVRIAIFAVGMLGLLGFGLVRRLALFTVPADLSPPHGETLLVWRSETQPLFDSPDGACLRVHARPRTLPLCRQAAVGLVTGRNVIARWGYSDWAYLRSTHGQRLAR